MSGSPARVAEIILRLAHRMMPFDRKTWAEAMAAEMPYIEGRVTALAFAAGCLVAACGHRAASLTRKCPKEVRVGACVGALFLFHASIPNSQSWPWIWPVIGGVLVSIAHRAHIGHSDRRIVLAGLKAGLVCGALFLAGGMGVLAIAAFHYDAAVVWRGVRLIIYGAFGAALLAPLSAAAASAIVDRLR